MTIPLDYANAVDPHRPRFHFAAPPGTWINDPVPFYDDRTERYHVFLQHNPNAPVWGDMHWLHVSSTDLLCWENHGCALTPSRTEGDPDFGGVWTGCVTRRPSDGKYVALYTAIPTHTPFTQVQCAAVSDDLTTWEKVAENPLTGLSEKPDGYGGCFRDPQTFGGPDGKWYCIIGGEQLDGKGGAAFLYEATDDTLLHWKYRHVLFEGDAETGHDFECPDFFPLPDSGSESLAIPPKWCLITSRNKSWWHVGTLDIETMTFTREAWGACDNELFYAAKSCVGPEGKRLLWGWIREARPEAEQVAAGWSGVLSLPRELTSWTSHMHSPTVAQFHLHSFPYPPKTKPSEYDMSPLNRKSVSLEHCDFHLEPEERLFAGHIHRQSMTVVYVQSHGDFEGVFEYEWRSGDQFVLPVNTHLDCVKTFIDGSVIEVTSFYKDTKTHRVYAAETDNPRDEWIRLFIHNSDTYAFSEMQVEGYVM